jgi:NADPH:quinone reductase-like Zn-dependent oxidoreductase
MALDVEAAGVVTAVGAAVRDWAPGDQVLTHPLPLRAGGTWAPQLIAPAALLARTPAAMSWAAAAAFPVPALTAEQALSESVVIKAGETLLIHGGGGVTGGLLVPSRQRAGHGSQPQRALPATPGCSNWEHRMWSTTTIRSGPMQPRPQPPLTASTPW